MTTVNTHPLRAVSTGFGTGILTIATYRGTDWYGEPAAEPRHHQSRCGAEPRTKMEAFWFVHIDRAGALTSHLSVLNDGRDVNAARRLMPTPGPTTRGGYSWWGLADNQQDAERLARDEYRRTA